MGYYKATYVDKVEEYCGLLGVALWIVYVSFAS